MIGRPRKPDAKHHVEAKASAKKLMKQIDEERPTLIEIYGIPPCPLLPHGQMGLTEIVRMDRPKPEPEPAKNVDLIMLPFGRGKLLGSQ